MNQEYALDQADAIEKACKIIDKEKPDYIRMEKQKDGRFLITWEGEKT